MESVIFGFAICSPLTQRTTILLEAWWDSSFQKQAGTYSKRSIFFKASGDNCRHNITIYVEVIAGHLEKYTFFPPRRSISHTFPNTRHKGTTSKKKICLGDHKNGHQRKLHINTTNAWKLTQLVCLIHTRSIKTTVCVTRSYGLELSLLWTKLPGNQRTF